MALELERRGYELAYVRTQEGLEVDFLAHRAGDPPLLMQVSLEPEGDESWLRALEAAAREHPGARSILITHDDQPPHRPLPEGIEWFPAPGWLLDEA